MTSKIIFFCFLLGILAVSSMPQGTVAFPRRITGSRKFVGAHAEGVEDPRFPHDASPAAAEPREGVSLTRTSTTTDSILSRNVCDTLVPPVGEGNHSGNAYAGKTDRNRRRMNNRFEHVRERERVTPCPHGPEKQELLSQRKVSEEVALRTKRDGEDDASALGSRIFHTRRLSSVDLETGELDEDEAEEILFHLLNPADTEEDGENNNTQDSSTPPQRPEPSKNT